MLAINRHAKSLDAYRFNNDYPDLISRSIVVCLLLIGLTLQQTVHGTNVCRSREGTKMVTHVGQHFGNYRLIRLLGRGSFTEVYLGEHVELKTQVAIKVLQARLLVGSQETFLTEIHA